MNYKKPNNEKKPLQPDYKDLWEVKEVRIVASVAAVVLGVYVIGKILRLMGQTVEDVRFFANAVKKR